MFRSHSLSDVFGNRGSAHRLETCQTFAMRVLTLKSCDSGITKRSRLREKENSCILWANFESFFEFRVETSQNEKWVIHMRARHTAMLFIFVPLEHTHKKGNFLHFYLFLGFSTKHWATENPRPVLLFLGLVLCPQPTRTRQPDDFHQWQLSFCCCLSRFISRWIVF